MKTCKPGDVFGELALLYNSPRAATVDATDKCVCWQLDRETFNYIVKASSFEKTKCYRAFLQGVSLFATMDVYEISQLADALRSETHQKEKFVVSQGDVGDKFFIVEEGTLKAVKDGADKVMEYGVGDYFGELALLKGQPRAANVVVTSETAKVLALDRKSFKKMLGPIENILTRRTEMYK